MLLWVGWRESSLLSEPSEVVVVPVGDAISIVGEAVGAGSGDVGDRGLSGRRVRFAGGGLSSRERDSGGEFGLVSETPGMLMELAIVNKESGRLMWLGEF